MKEKFPPVSQLTIRPTLNFIGNHCSVFFKKNFKKKTGRFVFVACCWCWILSTLHSIGLRKKDVSYGKEMALPKTWSRIFKTTKFNATQSRLLQDLQTVMRQKAAMPVCYTWNTRNNFPHIFKHQINNAVLYVLWFGFFFGLFFLNHFKFFKLGWNFQTR